MDEHAHTGCKWSHTNTNSHYIETHFAELSSLVMFSYFTAS
jgi:hypothetical protein